MIKRILTSVFYLCVDDRPFTAHCKYVEVTRYRLRSGQTASIPSIVSLFFFLIFSFVTTSLAIFDFLNTTLAHMPWHTNCFALPLFHLFFLLVVTQWGENWMRNGWKRSDGGNVLHRDIIEPLLMMIKNRPGPIKWVRTLSLFSFC